MKTALTNVNIQAFLEDYARNSRVEIEDSAKKKAEVIQIAKGRGINLKNSKDLAGFKTVYTIADIIDSNGQQVPKKELLKALPTLIGKPIDINHDRRYVVGHYIDYAFNKKNNQVIAYGVFYKSNFGPEWDMVKDLFKKGELGTSSEIWSDPKKRKYHKNGTFTLGEMELAGGALVCPPDVPAVKGANVLSLAKKRIDESDDCRIFFSTENQYQDEEILIAASEITEVRAEDKSKTDLHIAPPKTHCSNCGEEFSPSEVGNSTCPKCLCITDRTGKMLYPSQVMEFSVECPGCNMRDNWLLLKQTAKDANIRCTSCVREYKLEFDGREPNPMLSIVNFLYSGVKRCPQCSYPNQVVGVSNISDREIKCGKCGLSFDTHLTDSNSNKKYISRIKEVHSPSGTEGKDEKEENDMSKSKKMEMMTSIEGRPVVVKETEDGKIWVCPYCTEQFTTDTLEFDGERNYHVPCKDKGAIVLPDTVVEKEVVEEPKACECGEEGCEECKPTEDVTAEVVVETPAEEAAPEEATAKIVFASTSDKVKDSKGHYPIDDLNKAKNALVRVYQYRTVPKWYDGTLEELQKSVRDGVSEAYPELDAAAPKKDSISMGHYKSRISKLVSALRESYKAMTDSTEATKTFYLTNATTILERKTELGEYIGEMTDEQILDDKEYTIAKQNKEIAELKKAEKKDEKAVQAEIDRANAEDTSESEDVFEFTAEDEDRLTKAAKGIKEKAFKYINDKREEEEQE